MLIKQNIPNANIFEHLKTIGFDDFLANIIASRVSNIDEIDKIFFGSIKDLASPFLFKDIDKAVDRLYQAIVNKEVIGLETDHDCDGQTSHAILYEALTKIFGHPKDKIRSYIGHRMKEGYGLSEALMNRILTDQIRPNILITADNGSTDEPRINVLKQNNIDTIVTDHHAIPTTGVPESAVAVINPTQEGCNYPDKLIAGCMVAWLFMGALRRKCIEESYQLSNQTSLINLLDFVAIGTVADCVSMANSPNNRIVIRNGIEQLRNNDRLCWSMFEKEKFNSEYIGFNVAPILNSDGRISDALGSVGFLLQEDESQISDTFDALTKQNNERKNIQKDITKQALSQAIELDKNNSSLCILLEDGHAGIHGISASRIKDTFGKPVIIFSQSQSDSSLITGSARSVDEINIKNILDEIDSINPNIIYRYGGHKAAAGLTIKVSDFEEFYTLFEQCIVSIITAKNIKLEPVIYYDCTLSSEQLSLNTLDIIDSLEPYGRDFEKPTFCNDFNVENIRLVGKDKNHAQLVLNTEGKSFKAIWFNVTSEDTQNITIGSKVKACYLLQKEEFLGQVKLGLNIKRLQLL